MSPAESRASLHVYNARCALTVDPCRNRRGDVHTVNLESAARAGTSGDFDWANKIVVQVTGAELPDVLAVLLGHLASVEFRYHGASRDKGYRLFHDAGRLIVQIFAGARDRHTVTLAKSDRLRLSVALFRQLQRNHGGLSADVLHAMLAQIYAGSPLVTTPADVVSDRDASGRASDANAVRPPDSDAYDW